MENEILKHRQAVLGNIHKGFEEDDIDIEKSDIFNSLKQEGNSIKIAKTGKQIKQQVETVILPELRVNLSTLKLEADEKLKDCGELPTKYVYPWWVEDMKINCEYRIYDWEETCVLNKGSIALNTLSAEDAKNKNINSPKTEDEAKARREYNEIVQKICNILVDLRACEILNNVSDNKTYELTPLQVIAFKF